MKQVARPHPYFPLVCGFRQQRFATYKKDVTPAEASRLQATEGNMRWKAANVASLRASADEQRALQEALLCGGDGNSSRQQHA